MIGRILTGVKAHFRSRFWEWLLTGILAWVGFVILGPDDVFTQSQAYAVMRRIASEDTWGLVFVLIAAARAAALFLNGTFAAFRRFSPLVRAGASGLSGLAWSFIAMGLWQGDGVYIGAATYFGLMVGDFFLLSEILEEAGDAEREYRNGRA